MAPWAGAGGVPQPPGDRTQHLQAEPGPVDDPLVQRLLGQPRQLRVGDRHRGHGARTRVEQRQLTELVGRAHHGNEVLPAVGRSAAELDLAGDHDVEAFAGLALVEHDRAARHIHDLEVFA